MTTQMKKLTHETWRMIDTISLQGPAANTLQLNDEKMRITLRDEPEILEDVRVLVKAYVTGVVAVRELVKQLREGDGGHKPGLKTEACHKTLPLCD